jgi:hypothetical protein
MIEHMEFSNITDKKEITGVILIDIQTNPIRKKNHFTDEQIQRRKIFNWN